MAARPEKGPFNRRDSEAWEGDNCVPVFFSGEMCEQMGNKQCLLCLHTTQSILHLYILHHMSFFKKAYCLCLCNYHLLAFTVWESVSFLMCLHFQQGLLFVSSYSGLVEIPLANCSNYQSCGECVLSRDPYCAWTGKQCANIKHAPAKRLAYFHY